jgi:hypothetical protein
MGESVRGQIAEGADRDAIGGSDPERKVWGLRASYGIIVLTVRHLVKVGAATSEAIAEMIVGAPHSSRPPNIRRRSGIASAIQAVVTLGHLGLVSRRGGEVVLTERGERFARAIGTPEEEASFREAVLAYPPFASFWARLALQSRTVGRADAIHLAGFEYPGYGLETRKTLGAVCISYAAHAGLCKKLPGGHRYAVSQHWASVVARNFTRAAADKAYHPGKDDSSLGLSIRSSRPGPSAVGAQEAAQLDGLGRLLGWALADDAQLASRIVQDRVASAFQVAIQSDQGGPFSELTRLASEIAGKALDKKDPELLRWAIRCVNGILHAQIPRSSDHA